MITTNHLCSIRIYLYLTILGKYFLILLESVKINVNIKNVF